MEILGIAGSSSGVGVTHFSIMTANYLNGVAGKRTALLEWNKNGDFRRLELICGKNSVLKPHGKTFRIMEVSYVKEAGKTELLECMNHGYDAVVIDFGCDFEQIRGEFLRCDRKILLGSYCEWKVGAFIDLISGKKRAEGRWSYLTVFGNGDMRDGVIKALNTQIGRIPESADAFAITEEVMVFFEGFLKQ